jgi:gluconokinase
MAETEPQIVVVMGVAGSGKTTIGRRLAEALGWAFAEGDTFHSPANVAKMAGGTPLTDADRWPWLDAIGAWIRAEAGANHSGVVACSALKRAYRDRLRAAWPALRVVHLEASREELRRRVGDRPGHFFPERLVDSQFADLEPPGPDEDPIVVAVGDPDAMVREILSILRQSV